MVHINLIIKIKDYKLSFVNKDSLLFNILCNSYCEFEDFVVKTDLERHGLELSSLKNEIKNIIKENIDNNIRNVKSNRENKELIKEEVDKLLLNANNYMQK